MGPNQNKAWNWGHQHFRNALGRHANVVFYGTGWTTEYGYDIFDILEGYKDISFDAIICEGPKYAAPFKGLKDVTDILVLVLCVDYTDLYEKYYNDYLIRVNADMAIFHNNWCLENFYKRRKEGKVSVQSGFVVPFAADTAIYKDMKLPRMYDVGAIFSSTSWAYPLRGAIKAILRDSKDFKTRVAGDPKERIIHEDYVKVLNQCKIFVNSNCNWGGLNMKYTEAMACGCMFLTDKPLDMEYSGFKDKSHLVLYNGLDDMMDKLYYYVNHDEQRKKIAKTGMEYVRKTYSTDAMAKRLLTQLTHMI